MRISRQSINVCVFLLAVATFSTVAGPTGAALLTSEEELRDPAIRDWAVVGAWSAPGYFASRQDVLDNLSIFAPYGANRNFALCSQEITIRAGDFGDTEWATKKEIDGGNNRWDGRYYFNKLRYIFQPDVVLHVFYWNATFINRVCGNFSPTIVNPRCPVVLTCEAATIPCSDLGQICATLQEEGTRNPINGKALRFDVDCDGTIEGTDATGSHGPGRTCVSVTSCLPGVHRVCVSFAGDDLYLPGGCGTTLTVPRDPTTLTDETPVHEVEYSDPVIVAARLKDNEGIELSGKLVHFGIGPVEEPLTQECSDFTGPNGEVGCQPDNDLGNRDGYASCQIIVNQPASQCKEVSLTGRFDGAECYEPSEFVSPFTIKPEKAAIECVGPYLVDPPATTILADFCYTARISQELDGQLGDITKARLCFTLTDWYTGDPVPGGERRCVEVVDIGGGTGEARACFTGIPPGVYTVTVELEDQCYFAAPPAKCSLIVKGGFVTAGGTSSPPNCVHKISFGFNLKYKKEGQVPQGHFEFHDFDGALEFEADSNVCSDCWQWLAVSGNVATFQGYATMKVVSQGVTVVEDIKFTVRVVDNGEPGTNDTFAICMEHKPGHTCTIDPTDPDLCPIERSGGRYCLGPSRLDPGGNIQIHKAR
jgi:hypothetical protein